MRAEKKQARQAEIARAAYDLLAQRGYDGTSMLSIAKAAKASNETLYRWYGDKRGLFAALVRDNAADIREILEQALAGQADPAATLARVSPLLLEMLLGDRAILLNRAAAAEPSGDLGAAISAEGRDVIQPLVEDLLGGLAAQHGVDNQVLGDWYFGLLIGDLQIRRVIGVLPEPSREEITARCDMALRAVHKLLEEG